MPVRDPALCILQRPHCGPFFQVSERSVQRNLLPSRTVIQDAMAFAIASAVRGSFIGTSS
jgi:hypothetical protein